jgi:hypothetical protein
MIEHDAEMGALVQQLVTAGLIETFTDDDGDEAMRLTPDGEKIARQLALGADEDALLEALLEALLGETHEEARPRVGRASRARPREDRRRSPRR